MEYRNTATASTTQGETTNANNTLISICCNCSKIRGKDGQWVTLDDHVILHPGVAQTHGLCPECAKKLYPAFF